MAVRSDELQEVAIEDAWVAEIENREQGNALSGRIDQLLEQNAHVVVVISTAGSGKSFSFLRALRNWAAHSTQRSSLIELLTSPFEVPTPSSVLQARRNSEARREFLEEFGALTSAEVATAAGSTASNRSALANRWRSEGRAFAVTLHDILYYPGFQFGEDGRPLPVIARVLEALGAEGPSDWEIALWFARRSGWLGDRRPVDLLVEEPDLVVEAARRQFSELVS
jgi:hypothetical protein